MRLAVILGLGLGLGLALLGSSVGCKRRDAAPAGRAAPAAPFACGRESCDPSSYCLSQSPEVPRNMVPVSHLSCVRLPDACAHDYACACLSAHGVEGTCRDLNGGLRVFQKLPASAPPVAH